MVDRLADDDGSSVCQLLETWKADGLTDHIFMSVGYGCYTIIVGYTVMLSTSVTLVPLADFHQQSTVILHLLKLNIVLHSLKLIILMLKLNKF